MGKVERFGAYSFANFVNKIMSYNVPFITYSSDALNIGNALKLVYSSEQTEVWNGETLLVSTSVDWESAVTCYAAYSDSLFYAQFNDTTGRRIVVFYEIVNDEEYWAAQGSSGTGTMTYKMLTELTLYKVGDEAQYKHPGRLNYNAPSGEVDITKDALFTYTSSNIKICEDSNLVSCTTVPSNKIIHFGDENYFSLASKILFLID